MMASSGNKGERGKLAVISGPSGVGKSTVVKTLLKTCNLPLELSVSATTRSPRPGENDGTHYRFVTKETFEQEKEADHFLEYAEVFGRGDWYGTLRQPVEDSLDEGKWVILEIDVDGAMQVLQKLPETLTVFIHPGSLEELERRLRGRKTETEEKIKRRLQVADRELQFAKQYDFVVVNNEVETTAQEICKYFNENRSK